MVNANFLPLVFVLGLFSGVLVSIVTVCGKSRLPASADVKPSQDAEKLASLRVLLEQLNERGRHYGTVLWQVPFAYLGLAGLAVGAVKKPEFLPFALLATGLAGWAVLVHTCALLDGNRRAVRDIRDVEAQLGLKPTARWRGRSTAIPLQLLIVGAAVAGTFLGTRQLVLQPPALGPTPAWLWILTFALFSYLLWLAFTSTASEPDDN